MIFSDSKRRLPSSTRSSSIKFLYSPVLKKPFEFDFHFSGPLTFEEYDTSATLSVIEGQSDAVTSGDTTPPPTTHSSRRTINLPFRRRKPRKQTKESGSGSKEPEKETDSM